MADCKLVYKNNKGFWIHETYAQLIFQLIYVELQKTQYLFANKEDLLYDCEATINGWFNGYIGLSWEDEILNQTDEQTMILLLQNIITYLQTKGKYITISELKAMPTQDEHWKSVMDRDFPVSELIRIFNALIQMLQNTWESTNYDMKINWTL